jgi:predicted MFS family arabinose efflux permease
MMTPEKRKRLALFAAIFFHLSGLIIFLLRNNTMDVFMSVGFALMGLHMLNVWRQLSAGKELPKPTHKTAAIARYAAWVGALLGAGMGGYTAYDQGISLALSITIAAIASVVPLTITLFLIRKYLSLPTKDVE